MSILEKLDGLEAQYEATRQAQEQEQKRIKNAGQDINKNCRPQQKNKKIYIKNLERWD